MRLLLPYGKNLAVLTSLAILFTVAVGLLPTVVGETLVPGNTLLIPFPASPIQAFGMAVPLSLLGLIAAVWMINAIYHNRRTGIVSIILGAIMLLAGISGIVISLAFSQTPVFWMGMLVLSISGALGMASGIVVASFSAERVDNGPLAQGI